MKLFFTITVLVLLKTSLISQPKSGKITFGLIGFEANDTSKINYSEVKNQLLYIIKQYEFEVFFDRRKILVTKQDDGIVWKTLFDRKRQIAYLTWDVSNDSETIPDSMSGFYISLSDYISSVDSIKVIVGAIDH